ncbi:hypothetical protein, partial [Pseudomonas sp. GM21]|uniref:hypothetical protein n=1 Tax=Pseudomonas sp. GM21 TaxID=1144325 RepID=UPI001EE65FCB
PMGSSTPSAKTAASKNRLARAERAFKTPRASALNCSAICHFVVVLLRFPFIAVLDFSHNHLSPTGFRHPPHDGGCFLPIRLSRAKPDEQARK